MPTRHVNVNHPCDIYSRWRKLSFVETDEGSVLRVIGEGPFQLEVDGWLRTVTDSLAIEDTAYSGYTFDSSFDYILCRRPERKIGGRLFLQLEDGVCVAVKQNAEINLDGLESSVINVFDLPDDSLQPIDQWLYDGAELVYRLETALFNNPACSGIPSQPMRGDEPLFGRLSDGSWMIFDPSVNFETNTPSEPVNDGGKQFSIGSDGVTTCSNAPRTFLNENECQLSNGACEEISSSTGQIKILLDNSTIATLNDLTERYIYAIEGLPVEYEGIKLEHPCTPGLRSRWEPKKLSDCQPTELQKATKKTLFHLLSGSGDNNPFLRDIFFPEEGAYCNKKDIETKIEIEVNGECWTRVHPEHMSIFDVSIMLSCI